MPTETPVELPVAAAIEMPIQALAEMPVEAPSELPTTTPVEIPAEIAAQPKTASSNSPWGKAKVDATEAKGKVNPWDKS
jgi:hypothetical protein